MTVAFGKHDIKSVEDVAGLVPDDIRGYTETNKQGEKVHEEGILESFGLSVKAATDLIMEARVKAGWIDAADLVEPEEEEETEGEDVLDAASVFGN